MNETPILPILAAIILFASVVIPIAKFLAIAFLAISVTRPSAVSKTQRQVLYEVVEYIGRWSMIDSRMIWDAQTGPDDRPVA